VVIGVLLLASLAAGCGRKDIGIDIAGHYRFERVGDRWASASAQVKAGHIEVYEDGSFTLVDPLPQWTDPAPAPKVVRGWIMSDVDTQCPRLQNLLGSYCVYLVSDLDGFGARQSAVVNLSGSSKEILLLGGLSDSGEWIAYSTPR
jgi:hypothetical protein